MPTLRTMNILPLRRTQSLEPIPDYGPDIRLSGCWLTHISPSFYILEASIMGLQCRPAVGVPNFGESA